MLGVLFPDVKQRGCEVDHLPPAGGEVQNKWKQTTAPRIFMHGDYRDKFIFPYTTFQKLVLLPLSDESDVISLSCCSNSIKLVSVPVM